MAEHSSGASASAGSPVVTTDTTSDQEEEYHSATEDPGHVNERCPDSTSASEVEGGVAGLCVDEGAKERVELSEEQMKVGVFIVS